MKKQNNYIRYFAYNVDEIELYAYINEAIFDLIELTNMNENDIYKKYNLVVIVQENKKIEKFYIICF